MQVSFTGEEEMHIKEETQTSGHMSFKKYDSFNSGPKSLCQKTQSHRYVYMNTQRCLKYQENLQGWLVNIMMTLTQIDYCIYMFSTEHLLALTNLNNLEGLLHALTVSLQRIQNGIYVYILG